jgi:uncharacterized protein (DUF1800 family)
LSEQIDTSHGRYQSQDRSPIDEKSPNSDWARAVYQPSAQHPWNLIQAGHLFRRAAFGADWNQLQRALSDGPQRTIDILLRPQTDTTAFNKTYDGYENSAAGSIKNLRAWWLRRMIQTPHPLLEKMTLFWHSHFATRSDKVKNPKLMLQHIRLLRCHALNSFREMLQAASHDPASLISLGADENRKALLNENFARTLLENFTLGSGNHTKKDVSEAARAFTGWFVLRNRLRYIPREHDDSTKEIFGRRGNFTGDDVVNIVLEQPAVTKTIVKKLYRFLISETEEPDPALISTLAESFAKDYDISKLVETMLRSNLFFSGAAYRQRIKSPVEFVVGIVKPFETVVSTTQLEEDLAGLGQNLYNPPTVNGWAGGRHWIDSAAIVRRHNLASALLQDSKPYKDKLNPCTISKKYGNYTPESAAKFLLDLFIQGDIAPDVYEEILKSVQKSSANNIDGHEEMLRNIVYTVVTLPEFHLA